MIRHSSKAGVLVRGFSCYVSPAAMLFSTRVPPRARVTFVSAKVTKTICPFVAPHTQAQLGCGVPCAPRSARGFFDGTSLCREKRAHPMRAPQSESLRALSSPPCGARCDSRGGDTYTRKINLNLNLKTLKILTLGCFLPPFRRAEHRRSRRIRPDRGAPGGRALAAGQESCRPTPVSAEKRKGLSRRRGVFSFGYFSLHEQRKVPRLRCGNRN